MTLKDTDEIKAKIIKALGIKNEQYLLPSEKALWKAIESAPTVEPYRLLDDGTLVVTVEDATMIDKINRVIVEDGHMWRGLYYTDEDMITVLPR